MLKLLIVDDEIEIREGLVALNWAELGLAVTKVCEHGLEAYMWVQENPVDLVLTDIRMPHMDGIELAAKLHEQFAFTKVIVLSGHDDFEYARNCMRYGVEDYLLKPLRIDQWRDTMLRAVESLNRDKQQQLRTELLERRSNLLTGVLRKKFIQHCTTVPITEEEWEEGCSSSEMLMEHPPYTVCLLRFDAAVETHGIDFRLLAFAMNNVVNDLLADHHGYQFVNEFTAEIILIAQGTESVIDKMKELRKQLYSLRGLFPSTFSIGIGHAVYAPNELPNSRKSAEQALAKGGRDCIHWNEPPDKSPRTESGDPLNLLHTLVVDTSEAMGMNIVTQAKAYIRANYNRSITLTEVAEHVHFNASYLSYLFKEVSGENYISYLTHCRIEAARKLLRTTNYKVYEIGERVGYENPRYFSQIFRKLTSQTPYEYRNGSTYPLTISQKK